MEKRPGESDDTFESRKNMRKSLYGMAFSFLSLGLSIFSLWYVLTH
jgi:hypothetical protein